MTQERVEEIINFWFGDSQITSLPSSEQTYLWFGFNDKIVKLVREKLYQDWEDAVSGKYQHWEQQPRSRLALIILYDQVTRKMYHNTPMAYSQDIKAQDLCIQGIRAEHDRKLDLLERIYFYMPLIHSEELSVQKNAVQAYQSLVDLSLPEVLDIYHGFLDYAAQRYELINKFGRFPQRNAILGRISTPEEEEFLQQIRQPKP